MSQIGKKADPTWVSRCKTYFSSFGINSSLVSKSCIPAICFFSWVWWAVAVQKVALLPSTGYSNSVLFSRFEWFSPFLFLSAAAVSKWWHCVMSSTFQLGTSAMSWEPYLNEAVIPYANYITAMYHQLKKSLHGLFLFNSFTFTSNWMKLQMNQ